MSVRTASAAKAIAAALVVSTFTACGSVTIVRPERSWPTAFGPAATEAVFANAPAPAPATASESLASASEPGVAARFASLAPALEADERETRIDRLEPLPLLGGDNGYTRFSVGSFMPDGDIDVLDDGYYAQVAFGKELMPFLATEVSVGYLSADGPGNTELWAIPVLLTGRLQVPILIFELYGGIGLGGMFADYELGSIDDSDFVLAGTAFVGAEAGLGNLAVGLEYRYLASEDIEVGGGGEFAIEGHSVLLTLSFPF